MKSPEPIAEIIQPMTKEGVAPDTAIHTLDDQGYEKGQSTQCAER